MKNIIVSVIPKRLAKFREEIKVLNPNAQSVSYNMDFWKYWFPDDLDVAAIIQRFPEAITRQDIKSLADETTYNRENARQLFIATMIWGYGTRGYGPYRVKKMLDDKLANIILSDTIQKIVEGNIIAAYRDLKLPECGPAFMTKFFYFIGLSVNMKLLPVILDSRVAQSLILLMQDEGLHPTDFVRYSVSKNARISVSRYPDGYIRYIELMNKWAQELNCHADAIELFFFNPPMEFLSTEVIKNVGTKQPGQNDDDQFITLFDDANDSIIKSSYHVSKIAKNEGALLQKIRTKFFDQLLTLLKSRADLFSNISSPYKRHWIQTSAQKPGLYWAINATKKICDVELFFNHKDVDTNILRFEHFESHKKEIENTFDEQLIWDFKTGRSMQHIKSESSFGGLGNEEKLTEIQNDIAEKLLRLEKALSPFIKTLE
jgi:hypothetical protein